MKTVSRRWIGLSMLCAGITIMLAACGESPVGPQTNGAGRENVDESSEPVGAAQDLTGMPEDVRRVVSAMRERGMSVYEIAAEEEAGKGLAKSSGYAYEFRTLTVEETFNTGNTKQAIYPYATTNLCYKRPVSAYPELPWEPGSKAVDGYTSGWGNKWCSGYTSAYPTLTVEFEKWCFFDRWVVYGAKNESPSYYLRVFALELLDTHGNWRTVCIYDNSYHKERVSDIRLSRHYVAKKVRLRVYQGDLDGATRVYEFQVFNTGYDPMPGDILFTKASEGPDHAGIVYWSTEVVESNTSKGVHLSTVGKWDRNYPFGVLRVKNSTYAEALKAAEYARSKVGYSYNKNVFDYKKTTSFYCTSLVYHAWKSAGYSLDSEYHIGYLSVEDLKEDGDTYKTAAVQ